CAVTKICRVRRGSSAIPSLFQNSTVICLFDHPICVGLTEITFLHQFVCRGAHRLYVSIVGAVSLFEREPRIAALETIGFRLRERYEAAHRRSREAHLALEPAP